jgi:hypothetical protein
MQGTAIKQAKKAIEAGIAALRPDDRFSIVAFDDEIETLSHALLEASRENRHLARRYLAGISARGGTELASGVSEASKLVAEGGGDLLLLTDGQVFGTAGILNTARAAGARIHALGIGSASQDRFLSQLGRETGGRCRFLTARERVDLALLDLFASVSPAVAADARIEVDGETLATRDVYPGQPLLAWEERSGAELEIAWADGSFKLPVVEVPAELGETLRLLYGAAKITEVEARISGEPQGEEADVVVPVGLPQDLEMGAYFPAAASPPGDVLYLQSAVPVERQVLGRGFSGDVAPSAPAGRVRSFLRSTFSPELPEPSDLPEGPEYRTTAVDDEEDRLLEDALRLEADGGMPGDSLEERITVSLDLLERLVEHGSTRAKGPFRHHVRRLLEFLAEAELSDEQSARLTGILARVET